MRATNPLSIGLGVLLVLAAALYLASAGGPGGDDTSGGTLSAADRAALDAAPVERGADAGPDAGVDLRDPVAVASAYVVAGYSLRDTDAGHTNRRAVPYAAPATPPATVGVLVVNPPPAGRRVTATVTGVSLLGADQADQRRGYLVGYATRTEPSGSAGPAGQSRYLLLTRQADGRWLVAGDSADALIGEP
jgi:hypothetical protein